MHALTIAGLACIAVAGAIHVYIFLLESVLWRPRRTWRAFGIRSETDAEVVRTWALNQGYYNLFLAVGAVGGALAGLAFDDARWIAAFSALCMVGAALVLVVSSRGRLVRAALVQGAVPLLGAALLVAGALAGPA